MSVLENYVILIILSRVRIRKGSCGKTFPPFILYNAVSRLGSKKSGKKGGPPFFHPFLTGSQYPCHPFTTLLQKGGKKNFPPFFLEFSQGGYFRKKNILSLYTKHPKRVESIICHPFTLKKSVGFPPFLPPF